MDTPINKTITNAFLKSIEHYYFVLKGHLFMKKDIMVTEQPMPISDFSAAKQFTMEA
jgi:hypothetical protein